MEGEIFMNFDMVLGLIIIPLGIIGLGIAAYFHTAKLEGDDQ